MIIVLVKVDSKVGANFEQLLTNHFTLQNKPCIVVQNNYLLIALNAVLIIIIKI